MPSLSLTRCDSVVTNTIRYNMDMDRQFGFKPERPLLVFYDDLLKVYTIPSTSVKL